MPRPTKLKILGERPIAISEESDTRSVVEAFKTNGAPPPIPQPDLAEDVLAILRQHSERVSSEVAQAHSIASAAIERSAHAETVAQAVATETAAVKEMAQSAGQAATAALSAGSKAQTAALAGVALRSVGAGLGALVSFLVDRAPALMSLAGGWMLWHETLTEPDIMKLIGLGLYGACVVGPATWLTARK